MSFIDELRANQAASSVKKSSEEECLELIIKKVYQSMQNQIRIQSAHSANNFISGDYILDSNPVLMGAELVGIPQIGSSNWRWEFLAGDMLTLSSLCKAQISGLVSVSAFVSLTPFGQIVVSQLTKYATADHIDLSFFPILGAVHFPNNSIKLSSFNVSEKIPSSKIPHQPTVAPVSTKDFLSKAGIVIHYNVKL